MPVLEAGLAGIPAFCADLPPLRRTGGADVLYFDPLMEKPEHIASRILSALEASPVSRLRVRVRQHFRWEVILRDHLVPILEEM